MRAKGTRCRGGAAEYKLCRERGEIIVRDISRIRELSSATPIEKCERCSLSISQRTVCRDCIAIIVTARFFIFRTSLFIIMSFIYAKLLVVVCIAYVISEVVTHKLPLYYYEGFFTYLYGMSILFLLYVFCFLLQESACCARGSDTPPPPPRPPKAGWAPKEPKDKNKKKDKKEKEQKQPKPKKEPQVFLSRLS